MSGAGIPKSVVPLFNKIADETAKDQLRFMQVLIYLTPEFLEKCKEKVKLLQYDESWKGRNHLREREKLLEDYYIKTILAKCKKTYWEERTDVVVSEKN